MFVPLNAVPANARLVNATEMPAARRLAEMGWTVCETYLDGYYGAGSEDGELAVAASVYDAVSRLPSLCVVFTAGICLRQDIVNWLICSNSAEKGTGLVPIPHWFEDHSQPVPFGERKYFAGFQGTVTSNRQVREAVVDGFAGCPRPAIHINPIYFHALDESQKRDLVASYWTNLSQTQFSLCPRGDHCNSVRLYESLAAGCIPVLISDSALLPLANMLPWDEISIRVPETDARSWQRYVTEWASRRTDEELDGVSRHNRDVWQQWLHWSQLDKQLLVERVERAIAGAERRQSLLSRSVLSVPGKSSAKVRHLLNNLRAQRYLEVGVWQGSTFIAACFGRQLESAVAVDNFSQFDITGGVRCRFLANVEAHLAHQHVALHQVSFFDLPIEETTCGVDVFFYDGSHDPESQKRAITHIWPALAAHAIIVVDDINLPGVLDQTRAGLADVGAQVLREWLLPARFNGDTENWWNGLYVAAIRKSS